MKKRLQVVLSHAGVASRRKAAEIIEKGLVVVNNKVVFEKGATIDPDKDIVEVNGRTLRLERKVYYILNKPKGCVTTVSDEKGRQTVLDYIPKMRLRIYPVGRLDRETEGLLVLTNDGDLANKLMHPSSGIAKVYQAEVKKPFKMSQQKTLERGVFLDRKKTIPCKITLTETKHNSVMLKVQLHEGKKRQIRRMMEKVGCYVIALKRIAYAGLTLKGLSSGQSRELKSLEIKKLKELVGMD